MDQYVLRFFILFLFIQNIPILKAQQTGVYFGVDVGIQNSRILNKLDQNSKDSIHLRATFKPMMGIDVGWQFAPKFGIQTGFLLSQQGQKYNSTTNKSKTFSTDLSYVKIPLILTYKTSTEKSISFTLQGGVQVNFLYRAESNRNKIWGNYTKAYVDVSSFYQKTFFEFVFGLGTQYNISEKINLFTVLRADCSINDIELTSQKPNTRPISRNITVVTPLLGIHFFL